VTIKTFRIVQIFHSADAMGVDRYGIHKKKIDIANIDLTTYPIVGYFGKEYIYREVFILSRV
jgi:hypothetical protein